MKSIRKISLLFAVNLIVLLSCQQAEKPFTTKAKFGIHEIVKAEKLPDSIVEKLQQMDYRPENDTQQIIIGYLPRNAASDLQREFSSGNIMLVKTVFPIDTNNNTDEIVAVKTEPVMDNSDIQKTKNKGNSVVIYFTWKGAKKWAKITKENTGKTLAFVIDNQIYAMPEIRGEIRNGTAVIKGLENEEIAKQLSESIH